MDTSLVDVFPLEGDLNSTFGVLLIGFMFASLFYGCTFFREYIPCFEVYASAHMKWQRPTCFSRDTRTRPGSSRVL